MSTWHRRKATVRLVRPWPAESLVDRAIKGGDFSFVYV